MLALWLLPCPPAAVNMVDECGGVKLPLPPLSPEKALESPPARRLNPYYLLVMGEIAILLNSAYPLSETKW
jgi:hypothetical protein